MNNQFENMSNAELAQYMIENILGSDNETETLLAATENDVRAICGEYTDLTDAETDYLATTGLAAMKEYLA